MSCVLAATLAIAGLKAGITPGVSPLVVLISWALFSGWARGPDGVARLSIAQVAGSSGMAVTAGVIFTLPLYPILDAAHGGTGALPPLWGTIVMSVAGALIGFGVTSTSARSFLDDPNYPAPEARAAATLIASATDAPEDRPNLVRTLVPAALLGLLAPLVARLGLAASHVVLWSREIGDRSFKIDLPFTPIYIGIGALLSFGTALLVAAGAFLRLGGDLALTAVPESAAHLWPAVTMRWVGGGAMTVAVIYSLIRFFRNTDLEPSEALAAEDEERRARFSELAAVTETDITASRVCFSIGFGIIGACIVLLTELSVFSVGLIFSTLFWTLLMTILGAVLSLQIGSSASPVSGTVFATILVICLVILVGGRADGEFTLLLITALTVATCVAVCSSNDAAQDYRSMQLLGVPIRRGFPGQLLGLLSGAIVVPIAVYVAHDVYTLGSAELPAPQGQMFATLVEGLLFARDVPWLPLTVGLLLGGAVIVLERAARLRGHTLPAMALAVGIYLPAYLGTGVLIGALARRFGEKDASQSRASILAATGLITGAAAFDLMFGVGVLGGVKPESLRRFALSPLVMNTVAIGGIVLIAALIRQLSRSDERA